MPDFRPLTVAAFDRLTPDEATELTAQVTELARAGLPLETGLRALAEELPGRRLPRVLRNMADRLEAGQPLAEAIAAQGRQLPIDLRGVLLAGLRSGHLAEVMEEYTELRRMRRELNRRIWARLAYPVILLAMACGLFLFFEHVIVRDFVTIFDDFGLDLPPLTQAVVAGRSAGVWLAECGVVLLVGGGVLCWAMPYSRWAARMACRIPLIGPLMRFSQLTGFARLMAVLLEQSVPLPSALELTAEGIRDANLAAACRRVAAETAAGRSIVDGIAAQKPFPPTMVPVIEWGQSTTALEDAFRAAAVMFEGRARSQGALFEAAVLPLAGLMVAAIISFVLLALMMPMISLVQKLT